MCNKRRNRDRAVDFDGMAVDNDRRQIRLIRPVGETLLMRVSPMFLGANGRDALYEAPRLRRRPLDHLLC